MVMNQGDELTCADKNVVIAEIFLYCHVEKKFSSVLKVMYMGGCVLMVGKI